MFSVRLSRFLCLALFTPWFAAAAIPATPRNTSDIDRVLAIVNDDVVTETELAARLMQTKRQLVLEKIALPADEILRRQLIDRMVVERVQLQAAERAGIQVSDADVDRAVDDIARSNKMNVSEFEKRLKKEGLDPQAHVDSIRTQIIIHRLVDREVNSRVTVSDAEVQDFLQTHPQGTDIEFNLSHIFLTLPEAASTETIQAMRRRADDIVRQIKQGGNFEQIAIANSKGETALNGGAIGWKKAGQLPEAFLATLNALQPGGVSEPIRGPNGFHILRLNQRRGDSIAGNVTQTHARHILLRRSEIQSLDDARTKLVNLRERLLHGEDFAALAKSNSEDTASAANGGDLGWANPGLFTPEFEKIMNNLKPNELSEIVQTPFGLHLIQVLERRSRDISEERIQASARQQIHSRKANERYEQWVRQLRDEAYVEYFVDETN